MASDSLSPANIVPGIGHSPDKMLQARIFSYADAHRYRPELGFAPQSSKNEYLRHKSTLREEYDRAWRAAEEQAAFDMQFFN